MFVSTIVKYILYNSNNMSVEHKIARKNLEIQSWSMDGVTHEEHYHKIIVNISIKNFYLRWINSFSVFEILDKVFLLDRWHCRAGE